MLEKGGTKYTTNAHSLIAVTLILYIELFICIMPGVVGTEAEKDWTLMHDWRKVHSFLFF